MQGYSFALTCVMCGGELTHQADGVPQTHEGRRSEVQAVAYCSECRIPHRITVNARSMVAEGKADAQLGRAYLS